MIFTYHRNIESIDKKNIFLFGIHIHNISILLKRALMQTKNKINKRGKKKNNKNKTRNKNFVR